MNTCRFWNCTRRIKYGHFLCPEHFEGWDDGFIDKCPKCGRYKDIDYDECLNCYNNKSKPQSTNEYRVEHSKAWEKRDKKTGKFFVYILKDRKGRFYVGQTRDLRERLSEHKDGKTRSTAGRKMDLQYIEEKGNRNEAALREVELKKLVDSDERKVRKMIIEYQDRIREIKLG